MRNSGNCLCQIIAITAFGAGCATAPDVFRAPVTYAAGYAPSAIVAGDFNGDGKPDLAVANLHGGGNVHLLFGTGDGALVKGPELVTGGPPTSLAAADFNGDHITDLVVTRYGGTGLAVLLSGESGFHVAIVQATGDPRGVAIGDFNGDGKADLLVTNYAPGRNENVDYRDGTVTLLLGKGDGRFEEATIVATAGHPESIVAGDFNGDGKLDFAFTDGVWDSVVMALGGGDGSFRTLPHVLTGFGGPAVLVGTPIDAVLRGAPLTLAVADFNRDGKLDLAVGHSGVGVLLGNGDGTFRAIEQYPAGSGGAVAVGDWNSDGNIDIASGERILFGRGDGTFTPAATYPTGIGAYSVAVADFDADGHADLAVANLGGASVSMLLSRHRAAPAPEAAPANVTPAPAASGKANENTDEK